MIVDQLYDGNHWVHFPNEERIVIQDNDENVLRDEQIDIMKMDQFVQLTKSIISGSAKSEDCQTDHISNYFYF